MIISRAIPTNILTGFLGVGKTTAIQSLLSHKPPGERWAVLVNEFGEIGIDSSLMGGTSLEGEGVFLREVPGGCMCCAAGLPMQIALNQLISRAKPDRLLIEPTGLGHPREVIEVLSQAVYQGVLSLRATLTLVDARKIRDPRYIEHETFNQQLQIADVLVAHKQDLYQPDELTLLESYLQQQGMAETPLYPASMGQLELSWLDYPCRQSRQGLPSQTRVLTGLNPQAQWFDLVSLEGNDPDGALPECGYLRKDNQGEGFHSSGWLFSPVFEFDLVSLEALLSGLEVERLKAVFITSDGIFTYNKVDGVLSTQELDETLDSRIEVIGQEPAGWRHLEAALLGMSHCI